jgi:hypothetical protein
VNERLATYVTAAGIYENTTGTQTKTKKPRHAVAFMIRTACAFVRRESVTKPAAPLRERRAATSEFGLDAVHARKNTTRKALV